uniref:Uncharacterized protein n=1 Tax=Arundo donax TaxID=35708 RepID=A0A0A9C6T6_ARUDO
MSIIYSRSS